MKEYVSIEVGEIYTTSSKYHIDQEVDDKVIFVGVNKSDNLEVLISKAIKYLEGLRPSNMKTYSSVAEAQEDILDEIKKDI